MVRVHRKKIQNGQKGIRGLKGKGGAGVLHWPRGPDCLVEVCRPEESKEEVAVLQVGIQRGGGGGGEAAPEVRVAKSSKFGEGELLASYMDLFGAGATFH